MQATGSGAAMRPAHMNRRSSLRMPPDEAARTERQAPPTIWEFPVGRALVSVSPIGQEVIALPVPTLARVRRCVARAQCGKGRIRKRVLGAVWSRSDHCVAYTSCGSHPGIWPGWQPIRSGTVALLERQRWLL